MSYSRTTYRCTTIGAAAFHFRVRNGNGWSHCARITRGLSQFRIYDLRFKVLAALKILARKSLWESESLATFHVVAFFFSKNKISNAKSEILNAKFLWF